MGKKTLADELLELHKPQTDFDIENDEFANVSSSNEAEESSEDELKTDHYVKVSKSKLRKHEPKNIYGGQVSSRKDIFEGDDDNEMITSEEDEDIKLSDSGVSLDNYQSDSESEDQEDKEEPEEPEEHLEDEHKRDALKLLISKERQTIGKRVAQSSINDSLKGFSIINQNSLFDKLIESRIKLQKAVSKSNILPKDSEAAKPFTTSRTKTAVKSAQEKCYDLLDNIMQLRNTLYKKDSIETVTFPKKRKLNNYAQAAGEFDSKLNNFRSITLTKWSNKVMSSSGSNALNAGKFKVVNQSAEQQVVNNLNDVERLKKRTYLNRSGVIPLGYKEPSEEGNDEEEEANPDIPKEVVTKGKNEMPQIFDDEDFYRVLLNDLVEKKISSSNPVNGVTMTLRQTQKAQKSNKNVDTKASKGRKLKFNIQDPIAHFETPLNLKWEDFQIDELFASLLGQKVNMDEADEVALEDAEIINDDSIKLFS
ncbi:TRAUB-domain-containing protein [Yamadazyma tenuis ATCC 10573]|uniref:Protein BFR2 n=1 Tax=Candida tenuis (strain ATCC 10573 / BCRC 21748 / CBS 615 / JCM 9827 / NBRC 10315 / NRRL Y-1498 / VKM Y-70) TaxID=590646 RepID=G3B9D8_CANTC|nr:TRAUB-domain-containing protein [Yamadazyma tenuis ATCC 10573]EGV62480.1 TRAUB-domain-containing protein [Yamadazyma tenuis ATCC 10573]